MAYTHDGKGNITIPRADSVKFNVYVDGGGVQDGDAVVFRICEKNNHTAWAFTKIATVTNGLAVIHLTSADTKSFVAGKKYGWTIGIVRGLDYDDDGHPVAQDDNDVVLTAYNEFKDFVIAESGILSIDE